METVKRKAFKIAKALVEGYLSVIPKGFSELDLKKCKEVATQTANEIFKAYNYGGGKKYMEYYKVLKQVSYEIKEYQPEYVD